jgi:hypothetical protein
MLGQHFRVVLSKKTFYSVAEITFGVANKLFMMIAPQEARGTETCLFDTKSTLQLCMQQQK